MLHKKLYNLMGVLLSYYIDGCFPVRSFPKTKMSWRKWRRSNIKTLLGEHQQQKILTIWPKNSSPCSLGRVKTYTPQTIIIDHYGGWHVAHWLLHNCSHNSLNPPPPGPPCPGASPSSGASFSMNDHQSREWITSDITDDSMYKRRESNQEYNNNQSLLTLSRKR